MYDDYIIVTNNPLVKKTYEKDKDVYYAEVGFTEILGLIRDMVYKGHKLLTHPLSGSVKPTETPYKSVLVDKSSGPTDLQSVKLIESAIMSTEKFHFKPSAGDTQALADFQMVDAGLIKSAITSADV